MTFNDYERLRQAFHNELDLWKPSEHDFETSLGNAKLHSGLSNIRLSVEQKTALRNIYNKVRMSEQQCG